MAAAAGDRDPQLTISLLAADTPASACTEFADDFFKKFTAPHARHPEVGAYQDGCSIACLPATFDEYWEGRQDHAAGRNRRMALKRGYTFAHIDRDAHLDDIFEINTSLAQRQGREMSESYRTRPGPYGPLPDDPCPRHQLRTYGVFQGEKLVAYTWVYQVGEMCLFSTILGHGDHLKYGVMYLLVADAIRDLIEVAGTKYAMYNMHASGTDGLRFFKEQLGFASYWVNWQRGAGEAPFTGTPPDVAASLRAATAPKPKPNRRGRTPASVWRGVVRRARAALKR